MTTMMELNNITITSVIASFTVLATAWLFLRFLVKYVKYLFNPLRHAPGPKRRSFVFGEFLTVRTSPFMEPQRRWIQATGWNVPLLHYPVLFGQSSLLILDKDIVKQIMTSPYGKEPLRFQKDLRFLKHTLGEGLVTSEGDVWMRHRQIIQPAFYTNVLKKALQKIVPPMTHRLVECWKASQGRGID